MSNPIQPSYYDGGGYQLTDVIEDWGLDFVRGNVLKYICRAGKKANELEDLKKALWYCQRAVASVEKRLKGDAGDQNKKAV